MADLMNIVADLINSCACRKRKADGSALDSALKRPRVERQTREKVHLLLNDKKRLMKAGHSFYKQVEEKWRAANTKHHGKGIRENGGLEEILECLARLIDCDPRHLKGSGILHVQMLFDRFDTDSNGKITQKETDRLMLSILHRFSDPAALVYISDIADIPFKCLEDHYVLKRKLGEGGQGAMFLAKGKGEKHDVCVKKYAKSNRNAPTNGITQEFELLKTLNSPYIARTFGIFQDTQYIYVVNEPYFGEDLNHLARNAQKANVRTTERWFAHIYKQVLNGLDFLHGKDVIHCDLKEANVMVTGKNWHKPQIVLIDFGLAQHFVSWNKGMCGTPGYIPPETHKSRYWVPKGDVFACGVMFYQLSTGEDVPFYPDLPSEHPDFWSQVVALTSNEQVVMDKEFFSVNLCNLVEKMLAKNFRARPTASTCLQHAWLANTTDTLVISNAVVADLKKMKQPNHIQRIAAEALLGTCNIAQFRELNAIFRQIDADNDGSVTAAEARQAVQKLSAKAARQLKPLVDAVEKGGSLDYKTFMAQMIRQKAHREGLRKLFNKFDSDADGYISNAEVTKLVAASNFNVKANDIIKQADTNGDGKISAKEFIDACVGEIGHR